MKKSPEDKEWGALLRWIYTFEGFAHLILDNADVPSGPLRERMKIANLSMRGMRSFWRWSKEHGNA